MDCELGRQRTLRSAAALAAAVVLAQLPSACAPQALAAAVVLAQLFDLDYTRGGPEQQAAAGATVPARHHDGGESRSGSGYAEGN